MCQEQIVMHRQSANHHRHQLIDLKKFSILKVFFFIVLNLKKYPVVLNFQFLNTGDANVNAISTDAQEITEFNDQTRKNKFTILQHNLKFYIDFFFFHFQLIHNNLHPQQQALMKL